MSKAEKSSSRSEKFNKNDLIKIFQAKKLKEMKVYLEQIAKQNPYAQKAIIEALYYCLVEKKTTPLGCLTALYFYKSLLIRSQFDFLESDTFNDAIHKSIYELCLYKKSHDPAERGATYFIQTMKAQQTEDNEQIGECFIILALEIIQIWGEVYPLDYFTDETSRYKKYYDHLVNSKVRFPPKKQYTMVKEEEKHTFERNYQKWKKKMQEYEKEEKAEEEKKESAKVISNKEIEAQKKKEEQERRREQKRRQEEKKKQEVKKQEQRKKEEERKLEEKRKDQERKRQEEKKKLDEKKKEEERKKIEEKKKQQEEKKQLQNKKKQEEEKKKLQKEQNDRKKREEKKKEQEEKKKEQIFRQKQEEEKKKRKQQELRKKQLEKQQKEEEKRKEIERQEETKKKNYNTLRTPVKKKSQQSSEIEAEFSQMIIEKQIKDKQKEKKKKVESPKFSVVTKKNLQSNIMENEKKKVELQGQFSAIPQEESSKKLKGERRSIKKSERKKIFEDLSQKNISSAEFILDDSQKKKEDSHQKRIAVKVQKPKYNKTQEIYAKKKSIPKTEKRGWMTQNSGFQISPTLNKDYDHFSGKTLSHLRSAKKKMQGTSEQFMSNRTESLLSLMQRSKLDEIVVPYLAQYFNPVNKNMKNLLSESLKADKNNMFDSSKIFFENPELNARLIKEFQSSSYILVIQNKSGRKLTIAYSQNLQTKYGDQFSPHIKVKGYQGKKPDQPLIWEIEAGQFIDIRFKFQTINPNFKFLAFCLTLNKKVIPLYLPITLLDMGNIEKVLNLQKIEGFVSLYGRILKSNSFTLVKNMMELPEIFCTNKNKDSRVLGQICYWVGDQYNQKSQINILIKCKNKKMNEFEIISLFDCRQENSEDYAKVLIELLVLLLSRQH